MSILKKDSVLGTGGGAVAGGAAGAAIGTVVAGPIGLAAGAVVGGVLGAVSGSRLSHAVDSTDDLGHFEQIYRSTGYYQDSYTWDDYAPAYRYGLDSYKDRGDRSFAQAEEGLAPGWEQARGASTLTWLQARSAVEHAWRSLDQTLRGGPDDASA